MDVEAKIAQVIEPSLEALGYDLVRVQMKGQARRTLQVMTERKDRRGMTVDDCAEISRNISAILDVEDPVRGAYDLEVSSPGIDRPLVRKEDYSRFAGHVARVETATLVDGRKKFHGRLEGLNGEAVVVECDGAEVRIPFGDIARAKLVMTDELIAETMGKQDR